MFTIRIDCFIVFSRREAEMKELTITYTIKIPEDLVPSFTFLMITSLIVAKITEEENRTAELVGAEMRVYPAEDGNNMGWQSRSMVTHSI